jgi:hypothetical protein
LLGTGGALGAPECPANAPAHVFDGFTDPIADPLCGTCSCTPPAGACSPPTSITASTAVCAVDAGAPTLFDPPAEWDGGCTTADAVEAGALCSASSCMVSLNIGPLVLDESGCTPHPGGATMDPSWSTHARGCRGNAFGPCPNLGDTCGPVAPPGFLVCALTAGDVDCPSDTPYSDKYVFYQGADDTRACSPCACASVPGTCSGLLSAYADGACGSVVASVLIGSSLPQCDNVSILASTTLGSKSIQSVAYTPGACTPSGGVASGAVTPLSPATFCCLKP